MIVTQVPWEHPDAESLRAGQRIEIAERYGRDDSEPGPAPSADDITAFFVAYSGETQVACGGLRRIDDEHGEIKRMFVRPENRGTGASTAVLSRLEEEGRMLGWNRLVLETGDQQPDAIRFYEREGYTASPKFGHYVHSELSRCYAKAL